MTNPFGGGPKKAAAAAPAKKAAPAKAQPKAAAAEPVEEEADAPATTLTKAGPRKDPFALGKGSSGGDDDDVNFKDLCGELLLVKPTEADEMVTTASKGELQKYVICDIYRLEHPDEDGTPSFLEDVYVFQTVCEKKFRKVLNGPNNWALGRLERGIARGSKSAPYLFVAPEPEEVDAAFKWATAQGLDL